MRDATKRRLKQAGIFLAVVVGVAMLSADFHFEIKFGTDGPAEVQAACGGPDDGDN